MIDKPCRWVLGRIVRPSPKVPTPPEAQQVLWDEIQDGSLVGHSVLYSGPSKFGKTTMTAKLMEVTFWNYFNRGYADDFPNYRPPIWQVNVPDWMDAMRAYRNRDFDSHEIVRPPEPTSKDVHDWFDEFQEGQRERGEELSDGDKYPPILFLDELDKFSATEHTTRWLFNLLNAVMASGGAVISTTKHDAGPAREASSGNHCTGGWSSPLSTARIGYAS